MMEKMMRLFGMKMPANTIAKDKIAKLLQTSPEALAEFEKAYAAHALSVPEEDNFFAQNSRQAAQRSKDDHDDMPDDLQSVLCDLEAKIVNELLANTHYVYRFDGRLGHVEDWDTPLLPDTLVQNADLAKIPEQFRPELSGNLMKMDMPYGSSSEQIMFWFDRYQNAKNQKTRQDAYHHFRQGLDILDLDPLSYAIINTNPNSMSHWLPELVDACRCQNFFKIPATTIVKVPMTLLQLTRMEYMSLSRTTLNIVDKWAHEIFQLDDEKEYFIKTGTYSSKFDFRNAHVHGRKEVQELGEYLLFIHYQALQMASPLTTPCIYGVSTTNEWVVREFIQDKENNPCIYKGLPLHTEYRVFVDCDSDEIIGISPYWEPDTMKNRFADQKDADNPHQMHDYVIYKMHEETLMRRYHENKQNVLKHIQSLLPHLNLHGQWSIDIMQNGDDFYIIDMALAENSAFYHQAVPEQLRRPSEENWMPRITDAT